MRTLRKGTSTTATRRHLAQIWTWWGHLNNAQQLWTTVTVGIPTVLAALGAEQVSNQWFAVALATIAAIGAAALVLILYIVIASRFGLLPTLVQSPSAAVVRAGEDALRDRKKAASIGRALQEGMRDLKASASTLAAASVTGPAIPVDLLNRHVDDCRVLHEDVTHLLADAEFRARGGTILYAVDYSEIYAYIFPAGAALALRLFADDDEEMTKTFQYLLAQHLFFRPRHRVLLMSPHVMELRLLVDRLQKSSLLGLADAIPEAMQERESAGQDPEFAHARSWLAAAAAPTEGDQRLAAEKALGFLERRVPRLVSLLESGVSEPRERLAQLLAARPFDLAQPEIGDVVPNPEVVRHWELILRKLHSRYADSPNFASIHRDAIAVATVRAANERLLPRRMKLVLVSRTKLLHEALKQEVQPGELDATGGYVLRHPRSLAPILNEASEGLVERLSLMRKSLSVLLASYEEFQVCTDHRDLENLAGELERSLALVKSQWRSGTSLSSVIALARSAPEQRVRSADHKTVLQLFRMVDDSAYLKSAIRGRITGLATEFDREQQLLGVTVQGEVSASGLLRVRDLKSPGPVFEVNLPKVPYALQFYSRELRRWWEGPEQSGSVRVEDLLRLLRAGFDEGRGYEPLLLVAYVFAAHDQWHLAEMYADLALEGRGEGEPPPHEGEFFLAVCKRMHEKVTPALYQEAFSLLREARLVRARARSEPAYEDPRYLTEEGTLVLIWNKLADSSAFPPAPASPETAVGLLEDALMRIIDDDVLRTRIHNNLCYYFLQSRESKLRDQARRHRDEIVKLQEEHPDRDTWPANLLDTVLWAEWVLADGALPRERAAQIAEALERATARASPQDSARRTIVEHAHAIRTALAG